MKITKLTEQLKNPSRVNVFVDDKYSFSLTIDEILEHKIKLGIELGEPDLVRYKKISSDGKFKARAYEWLLNRPRSISEFKMYMRKKNIDTDLQQRLVNEFTGSGVINEQRFGQWTAERYVRKNKSLRALQNQLRSKGINSDSVGQIMSDLKSSQTDETSLRDLVTKLSKRTKYQEPKKLISYLLNQGFDYSDIKQVLKLRSPEDSV